MSGYGGEEVTARCRASGFDLQLVKPIIPPALADLLNNGDRTQLQDQCPRPDHIPNLVVPGHTG